MPDLTEDLQSVLRLTSWFLNSSAGLILVVVSALALVLVLSVAVVSGSDRLDLGGTTSY